MSAEVSRAGPNSAYCAVAGIVAYHPDPADLRELVASIAHEVAAVIVFANSPIPADMRGVLQVAAGATALEVIEPGGNLGLGVAYGAIIDAAEARGAEFVMLLDQDSTPTPHMVARLVALFRGLCDAGMRPALVGPQPVRADGRPMRTAFIPNAPAHLGARPARFAISSGSLVRVATVREIGPFRADFFIDAIDLEWCMRATHRGYSIWIARDIPMPHRLGRGFIRLPGGLLLTDQPPSRLYTYVRNQIAMLRLAHVPRAYKAKWLLCLPVRMLVHLHRNRFSRDSRTALLNGLRDGLRNRLGPPTAP